MYPRNFYVDLTVDSKFNSLLEMLFLKLGMPDLSCSCSWNATYESLLGTNKRFYKPIPLSVSTSIPLIFVRILDVCRLLLIISLAPIDRKWLSF